MIAIGLMWMVLLGSVCAAGWDPAPWRRADLPPIRGELPPAKARLRKRCCGGTYCHRPFCESDPQQMCFKGYR